MAATHSHERRPPQFRVSTVLLLTAAFSISLAWWLDHNRLVSELREARLQHSTLVQDLARQTVELSGRRQALAAQAARKLASGELNEAEARSFRINLEQLNLQLSVLSKRLSDLEDTR